MLKPKPPQTSFYRSYLYDRYIHQDHLTGTALTTDNNGDSLGTIKAGLMGRNMLTLPLSRVREQFMNFPEIRDVIFKRKLFHQLDCYLQKREPVALIAASDMFEVDESGFVIPSRAGGSDRFSG